MTISILFRLLELAEYQEKMVDASIYYKEAFGITPEKALENEEKLHQMEELVASLEAEVKRSLKKKKKKNIFLENISPRKKSNSSIQDFIQILPK